MNMKLNKNKNSSNSSFIKVIFILYFIIVALLIGVAILNNVYKKVDIENIGIKGCKEITDKWFNENEEYIDFYQESKTNKKIVAYYRLQEDEDRDVTIAIFSKNVYINVYIEEEKVYETKVVKGILSNNSPGSRWNMVKIKPDDAGRLVRLEVIPVYNDYREKIGEIYMGDRASIVIEIIKSKLISLLLCLILIFISIINFSLFIILSAKLKEKYMSILYLAILVYIVKTYIFLKTYIVQLFSNNIALVDVITNITLMLGVIPLYLYMNEVYGILKNRCIKSLCVIDIIYIIVLTITHSLGILDYYQGMIVTVLLYLILFCILVHCVIHKSPVQDDGFDYSRTFLERHMQQLGISILLVSFLIQGIAFIIRGNPGRIIIIQFGVLLCIICLGIGDFYKYRAILRRENELVNKLAYVDILTQIGNRAAYSQCIQKIVDKQELNKICIVIFDINNLKTVNDEQGHIVGDKLIYISAKIIDNTFGTIGQTYRIGGDEFVVIISDEGNFKRYKEVCDRFKVEIDDFNENTEEEFKISIAYGMDVCYKLTEKDIEESTKIADCNMYRKKEIMKK